MESHCKFGRKRMLMACALAGIFVIVALALWLRPNALPTGADGALSIGYKDLQPVLAQRCYPCHGEKIQMKNIRLDAPHYVKAYAPYMYRQVVVSRLMPQSNTTSMSEDERQLVKQWFEAGARTD